MKLRPLTNRRTGASGEYGGLSPSLWKYSLCTLGVAALPWGGGGGVQLVPASQPLRLQGLMPSLWVPVGPQPPETWVSMLILCGGVARTRRHTARKADSLCPVQRQRKVLALVPGPERLPERLVSSGKCPADLPSFTVRAAA